LEILKWRTIAIKEKPKFREKRIQGGGRGWAPGKVDQGVFYAGKLHLDVKGGFCQKPPYEGRGRTRNGTFTWKNTLGGKTGKQKNYLPKNTKGETGLGLKHNKVVRPQRKGRRKRGGTAPIWETLLIEQDRESNN